VFGPGTVLSTVVMVASALRVSIAVMPGFAGTKSTQAPGLLERGRLIVSEISGRTRVAARVLKVTFSDPSPFIPQLAGSVFVHSSVIEPEISTRCV
jgi:hypothetical protein